MKVTLDLDASIVDKLKSKSKDDVAVFIKEILQKFANDEYVERDKLRKKIDQKIVTIFA